MPERDQWYDSEIAYPRQIVAVGNGLVHWRYRANHCYSRRGGWSHVTSTIEDWERFVVFAEARATWIEPPRKLKKKTKAVEVPEVA